MSQGGWKNCTPDINLKPKAILVGVHLKLDGVTVSYAGTTALHPLSLNVAPGEFVCLLGPSGCGKTTTLGVIAGFLPSQGGRVLLGDQDVTRLSPQRRQIGVVFQNYALFPHMTVAENIGYGLRLRKQPKEEIKRRVDELLVLVHLSGKGDRLPRQLSGGEQQRVAIARALAIEPNLLLMDEPLSNLDARLREEMRDELKRIQRETGLTTVFVTHDQEEALSIGDRVAVLNKGRLEQVGSPQEIYKTPATHFVAQFIGRSNKFSAKTAPGEAGVIDIAGQRILHRHDSATSGTFFLRPEEISLEGAAIGGNSVSAVVEEAIYGGAVISYRLRSEIGDIEVARLISGSPPLSIGEQVRASWSADAGVLLANTLNG